MISRKTPSEELPAKSADRQGFSARTRIAETAAKMVQRGKASLEIAKGGQAARPLVHLRWQAYLEGTRERIVNSVPLGRSDER